MEFFKTEMGKKFYGRDVPNIVKALESIGKELKRANDLKEAENDLGKTEQEDKI